MTDHCTLKVIFLFPVPHCVQHWSSHDGPHRKFSQQLFQSHSRFRFDALLEEFSHEAKIKYALNLTTTEKVAQDIKIKHYFMDPSSAQRQALGIESEDSIKKRLNIRSVIPHSKLQKYDAAQKEGWPPRENFWLTSIINSPENRCAVVIGRAHELSFSSLLRRKLGHNAVQIIHILSDD